MTIIYVTEHNTKGYGVTFENKGSVKVQKFEDISADENNVLCVRPMRTFGGKSRFCDLTEMSGAKDKKILMEILFYLK